MAIPVVCIALCTVMALANIGRRSRSLQLAAVLGLGGLWLWNLKQIGLAPFPTWDASVPAGYRCLAEGGDEALIELPYSWTQSHLYYQVEHGRPILGGMLENNRVFTPEESVGLRTENSFVRALLNAAKLEANPDEWTEQDKEAVHASWIRLCGASTRRISSQGRIPRPLGGGSSQDPVETAEKGPVAHDREHGL
jgi:hypothetical protein